MTSLFSPYYVEEHHEAIIPSDLFDFVQKEDGLVIVVFKGEIEIGVGG